MNAPREHDLELATGLRYHVREWGDASSSETTTILVHGFLDSSATWLQLARTRFGENRHLVAPDMRGHGDSDRAGAGGYYHFADYLADMEALFAHFEGRRLNLVGHSMGGSICAYITGTYPDRIDKLALLEGMGPPVTTTTAPARVADWIAQCRKVRESSPRRYSSIEDAAARLKKFDPLLGADVALELAEHGTRLVDGEREFKHDRLHATRGPYPFRLEDAIELWSNIRCPVLALEGSESVFRHASEEAAKRYSHIEDLRREVIPGAAHMMQRHQPEAIGAVLCEFLDA